MLSDVPNLALSFGYTNASWTLKADLVADYVCRLLGHLDRTGTRTVVPRPDPTVGKAPFMTSGAGCLVSSSRPSPARTPRQAS